MNENYPEYEILDEEGDGTFTLINTNYPNELMSYHRSSHEVGTYHWAPVEMLEHERIFNCYIETMIIPEVDKLENILNNMGV